MSVFDWAINKIADSLASRLNNETDETRQIIRARSYRMGAHKPQLRVRVNQFDDNITLNFAGLIPNRIISAVLGEGIEFRIDGDDNEAAQEYLDMLWDANKKEILLHRAVLMAAEAGTGYILINPPEAGVVGEDGVTYPRLMLIDPLFVTITTMPEDWEIVTAYTIEYKFTGLDGKEHARRRVIENDAEVGRWVIVDYEQQPGTGSRWVETSRITWPYNWPPMIHWQSNPSTDSQYGEADVNESFIALQDHINANVSNVSKIVRLHAHPQTVFKNANIKTYLDPLTGKPTNQVDMGPDKAISVTGDNAEVFNLEQLNDLTGPMSLLTMLRQTLFDTSRVVDIDSIQDKLGALTNFGLRVLYQDQLAMVGVKRELLGDALEEINRRVLEMAGMTGIKTEVVWPQTLPVNEIEMAQYFQQLEAMQVIDRQTIAEELGLNWETIQERMKEQQDQERANQNIGEMLLLRDFNRGGNAEQGQPPGRQRPTA